MGAGLGRPFQGCRQGSPAVFRVFPDQLPGAAYVLVQEQVERLSVDMLHPALLIDHEVGEERLVEQPPHLRPSGGIGGVAVLGQVERERQVRFDLLGLSRHRAQPFLDGRQAAADPFLFASDELHRHGAAVDGLDQLLTLGDEAITDALRAEDVLCGDETPVNVARKDIDPATGEPVPGTEQVITVRTPDERLVLLAATPSRSAEAIKNDHLDPELRANLRQRYDTAVGWGIATNQHRDWKDGKNHPGYVLAQRLRDKAEQVWLWTTNFAVPFTNNASERALKNPKLHQKVSGYWHTMATLTRYCRLRSYLISARNHGVRPIDAIHTALAGHPWLPPRTAAT
jgi:hypothetical protein